MRITTWNVNGLRAALRKGFADVVEALQPDVLLLQEIRCRPDQLPEAWRAPEGWHVAWHPAERPGYAGTAVWSRAPLERVEVGLGDGADPEGRVLRAVTGGVDVVSVYFPSGSAGDARQAAKEAYMDRFGPWAAALAAEPAPVILGGDMNVAHTEDDIWNPKGNAKNSGFMPHERAWFGDLLDRGWTDTVRAHVGPGKGPYSWWSNRGRARELDRGWRIDYLLTNGALGRAVRSAGVERAANHVSDHAPVTIELG